MGLLRTEFGRVASFGPMTSLSAPSTSSAPTAEPPLQVAETPDVTREHTVPAPHIGETMTISREELEGKETTEMSQKTVDEVREAVKLVLNKRQENMLDRGKRHRAAISGYKPLQRTPDAGIYNAKMSPEKKEEMLSDIDAIFVANDSLEQKVRILLETLRGHISADIEAALHPIATQQSFLAEHELSIQEFMKKVPHHATMSERIVEGLFETKKRITEVIRGLHIFGK